MVYRQLMISPGLVSLSMQAHPLTRKYWTLSVWKDETAIHNFVSTKPHKDIMKQMSGNMEQTSFKSWQVHGGDLPLDWKKSIEQLA
jgi:heme-degrading monooxygenase HmoA